MKIREIIGALEDFAPLALQDGFDNSGLQIGLPEDADATGVLLSLDVTEDVLDEAISLGCNMVISHHPLLFHPLKSVSGKDYVERCVIKAIKNGITLYAAHTNLDNAPNGVNYRIADKLGLQNIQWLDPKNGLDAGSGIVGTLKSTMRMADFVSMVKDVFNVECVRYNDWDGEKVHTVAVCGGAGSFLMPKAVELCADAFLTGEIGYHRFFGYERQMLLMEIGHFESEQFTLDILEDVVCNSVCWKKSGDRPALYKARSSNPIMYR